MAAREDALREAEDPVQCCFIGLAGVSTLLIAIATLPYTRSVATVLFVAGALFTLGFALWRTGRLWQGGRENSGTTPVLYLPTVAGAFVTAIAAVALGYSDWGRLAFGAGLFSWLAIESVLLQRLYTAVTLPPALRPTLGIQLAPPTVGALAYLSVTTGPLDSVVPALLGYGLLQALLLLRLLPWIARQPFAPSYWAFSFGATALASVPLLMIERGATGAVMVLAPPCFLAGNLVVAILTARTVALAAQRPLLRRPLGTSRSFTPAPAPISRGISQEEHL
jgi:tellurite resistance protein